MKIADTIRRWFRPKDGRELESAKVAFREAVDRYKAAKSANRTQCVHEASIALRAANQRLLKAEMAGHQ